MGSDALVRAAVRRATSSRLCMLPSIPATTLPARRRAVLKTSLCCAACAHMLVCKTAVVRIRVQADLEERFSELVSCKKVSCEENVYSRSHTAADSSCPQRCWSIWFMVDEGNTLLHLAD